MQAKKLISLIAISGLMLSGCTTAIKNGYVISVKQRIVGLSIGQNTVTQSPEVHFGLTSTVVQYIPTSTNELFKSPNYFDTFDFGTSWGTGVNIQENTGSGNVMTGTNGYGRVIVPR